MVDLVDTGAPESAAPDAALDAPSLINGDPRQPDQGEGEKQPDQGEGEKQPEGEIKDPAEGEKPEDDKPDDAPEGAPEVYEDFAAPEGVTLNAEALDKFKEVARAHNLPQAEAQKYVDLAAEMQAKQADAFVQQIIETRQGWKDASENDPEFGGDKFAENLATAKVAYDAYGSPELKKLMDETGIGNHPEIIRFMVKAGRALSEDKAVNPGNPVKPERTTAQILYGNKE